MGDRPGFAETDIDSNPQSAAIACNINTSMFAGSHLITHEWRQELI